MKFLFVFLIILTAFKTTFCQEITNEDSITASYKIYRGKVESNKFEGGYGTYTLVASEFCNYVEISTVYWKTIDVKYRLEKLSNYHAFIITKTMFHEKYTSPICYIAIDSMMSSEIKKEKKSLTDLKKEQIYVDLRYPEPTIFSLFLKLIIRYNLQSEYLKYEPKSFVAWLKVKN